MLSGLAVDNPGGFSTAATNRRSWSGSANLFYSPVPGMDLGVEYRYAHRQLLNGQDGDMNRLHLVAKQTF